MAEMTVARRPLFMPGMRMRMWRRLWPLVAFYVLATPAGFMRGFGDNIGPAPRADFNFVERLLLWDAPSAWLQSWLLDFEPLRLVAAGIYCTWFIFPLTAAAPLLMARPHDYWRFIGYLVIVYYAAMPFFALYPLEPPWMHNADVVNVVAVVFPQTVGQDPNPYAAMPSLHIAMPAAAAIWYGWRHPYGKFVWAYTAVLTLTVVYTGAHYFIDAVAGVAMAYAVYVIARRLQLPLFAREVAAQRQDNLIALPLAFEPERADQVA